MHGLSQLAKFFLAKFFVHRVFPRMPQTALLPGKPHRTAMTDFPDA
jgi:hypothetical protein